MQFRTTGLLLLGAMALPASGAAQTTAAPPAITRAVIAATKLPTVTDGPLHFKAVSITLQPDERSSVSAANGILYQMSGSTEVALDGETKMLDAGEGLFIAGGKTAGTVARCVVCGRMIAEPVGDRLDKAGPMVVAGGFDRVFVAACMATTSLPSTCS